MNMKLAEFTEEMRKDFEDFKEDWMENAEANPVQYPLELPPGEWFEQYLAWVTLNRDEPYP